MDILVRKARIIDPTSPYHQQITSIFIRNGIIASMGGGEQADQVVEAEGLCVSPGWTDIFASFCDPGYEYRETLQTGSEAAASGGYTDVLLVPDTSPALHNKSAVEYIVRAGTGLPVRVHPIGAVSRNTEGKELAEMYDMHASGAPLFSDGWNSIQSSGLLLKALLYVRAINSTIIQLPDDHSISRPGLVNEGIISTRLGLPGKPAIAEELMIRRDIELARYTGSRIHITGISTAVAVELVRQAKSENVSITCSVTPYHLLFSDEDLVSYDTNLKVNPPLRTPADREALRSAVMDGTVDCIASHHLPGDDDHKLIEFEYAQNGMIGLETAYAVVSKALPKLPLDRIPALFSANPRKIAGFPELSVRPGAEASLTLFLPDTPWTPHLFRSRSGNSPFKGYSFSSRPLGIINKDRLFLTGLN